MEDCTKGSEIVIPRRELYYTEVVKAPQDYFLGPFFAATRQNGPREVTIGEKRYQVGGFHPLKQGYLPPALDVRHGRAIFTLLSFRDPYENSRRIRFSLNEFCRRYANSNGGRYFRDIRQILGELIDSFIQVTDLKTGYYHQYRLIDYIDIKGKVIRRKDSSLAASSQTELWFHGCDLSEEFYSLLGRVAELQHLKLKVFNSIRSPLAQSIYLYIPSRAFHRAEDDPFEITLTKLLEQVSFRIPRQKQRRHQIFTQHANEGRSIIQQLDGLETWSGRFRVALKETDDKSDWKLLSWMERTREKPKLEESNSKMIAAYLQSGRPRELLEQALAEIKTLTDYEEELLKAAIVDIERNRRFFEMAKAILREARFVSILAEAKADMLEGRPAKKSNTARLIHRIMEAVGAPMQKPILRLPPV
jgi:hypothetical protein